MGAPPRGNYCKIEGNKRLKERGKAAREERIERRGNRRSIRPAQRWYQSMQQ